MKYRDILQKAYGVTINNPILWIFGLFLSAGFNLNMAYIGTAGWYRPEEFLIDSIEIFRAWPFAAVAGGVTASIILFLVSTYLKTFFVTESHLRIHDIQTKVCPLCVSQEEQKTFIQRLPRSYSVGKIALASLVTITVTLISVGLLNHLLGQSSVGNTPAVISLSALATIIIMCGIGCWNVFAVLFILWYGRSFNSAARLSFDLLSVKTKQITEFIILLAVLYGALVIVGSVLILMSQFSFTTLFAPLEGIRASHTMFMTLRALALIAFWVWLSISNVFFNVCLFIFFDELVKPVQKEEEAELAASALA